MIQDIAISGLRGFSKRSKVIFSQPTGSRGSGLTFITGPNNTGKSTIIEALKIRSYFSQNPSFNIALRNSKLDSVKIEYNINGVVEIVESIRPGSSETNFSKKTQFSPYVVPSRRHFNPYFSKGMPSTRDSYVKQFTAHQPLREQVLSQFESRLFAIEKNHHQFDALMKKLIPEFMDWSLDQSETGQFFIKLKSLHKTHSIAGSGDGIISLFVIASALFDSSVGDMIAIDEPELSLHPSLQKRLIELLKEYAVDRQIVISTHSPYMIDTESLNNSATIIRMWDINGNVELNHCNIQNCLGLQKLLSPNINNPHVFGLDAKEIFFADDPIIVFEGQEDVVLWPHISSINPDLNLVNIYGWGAGGASNIKYVIDLLKQLGFKKVCAVLDNNRTSDKISLKENYPEFQFLKYRHPI